MNTRAFLGALAALSLASACPEAHAQVQASQSGWQWGNPTPQGNTIRALDVIAGRGYAIGDDGTALRTDDGGATWTGLATGTSQDLTRVQAVTPLTCLADPRRRRLCRAPFRRRRQDLPQDHPRPETNCPEKVSAAYFVTPEIGYLLLRNGNILRTTDGGESFGRGTAIPGTPGSSGGGQGVPADAIFTTSDAGVVFLAGTSTAFTEQYVFACLARGWVLLGKAVLVPARNTMPASEVVKIASAGTPWPPPELPGVPGIAVPRPKVWPPSVVRSTLPLRSSR